jgi:endonuclease YncB( thermonuclease family)
MKGYAMIGNHVNENMGLPREMPDGRSRADYLNRLREAERYAKINKSGVWSFSRDTGTLGTE